MWHYTCDHGRAALGVRGWVVPAHLWAPRTDPYPTGQWAWFTDLATPNRDALGLTMNLTKCDRTAYRYRVTDEAHVVPWMHVRRHVPGALRDDLESAPGARPRHWWVSVEPVPVVLDQRPG